MTADGEDASGDPVLVRPPTSGRRSGIAHVPALDGIRGVAAALVVVYHAIQQFHSKRIGDSHVEPPWNIAGFLGVDLFFVLSGYLVASMLLSSSATPANPSSFWMRRVARLFPALTLLFVVQMATAGLFDLPPDGLVISYIFVFVGLFNFRIAASQPIVLDLTYLWSLSVEWQYYVVAPAFVGAVRRAGRSLMIGATLAVIVAITIWRAVSFANGTSLSVLYIRTDYRLDSPLAGALLAIALPMLSGVSRRVLAWTGWVCGGVLATIIATTDMEGAFLYRGGFLIVSICAVGLVWSAVGRAGPARLFEAAALRWLGKISYALYLWHVPIFFAIRRHWSVDPLVQTAAGVALSLAASVLSLRLVEQPWRRRLTKIADRRVAPPDPSVVAAGPDPA